MIFTIGNTHSIANHFLRSLRDPSLQQDRARFRNAVERLGEIMAYEISKKLTYEPNVIQTPLGQVKSHLLLANPVLITVLRAGLPYFSGFLNCFENSDCGFIGAYRKEKEEITVQLDYLATPNLNGCTLILIDPMLATGKSIVRSLEALHAHGIPAHVHIASLVAAPEGIAYIQQHVKLSHDIWSFSIDEKLNAQSYITPGLGDAGDLCFGDKL